MDLTLLIMAAGMGKRFGGLKQFYPFGPEDETLLEYSIFDALKAGFNRFVCIIRPELEDTFRATILAKVPKTLHVQYIFQRIDELPHNVPLTVQREKPWGTGHTIWSARHLLNSGPFAVINADDHYGHNAFKLLADFFNSAVHTHLHANVTFPLKTTLSPHGAVCRGVCTLNDKSEIVSIKERTNIQTQIDGKIIEVDANKKVIHTFTGSEPVSVNCWGFWPSILSHVDRAVTEFFKTHSSSTTDECLLPEIVDALIQKRVIGVQALQSQDQWTGVTYPQDIESTKELLLQRTKDHLYSASLWKNTIVSSSLK